MRKHTRRRKSDKPAKPYDLFPLTPHNNGLWCKKILGTTHYFGPWAKRVNGKLERVEGDGWREALELYKAQKDDLHAGRTPVDKSDAFTVHELVEKYLASERQRVDSGELSELSFREFYSPWPPPASDDKEAKRRGTCQRVLETFGRNRPVADLRPEDFERYRAQYAKKNGPHRVGNEVQRVRSLFKYAYDQEYIDKPARFGKLFKKPSKKTQRIHRATQGPNLFAKKEHGWGRLQILKLLDATATGAERATRKPVPMPQLRAMILLGINCGFGNSDCGWLPKSALDLGGGWLDFPRPKTGVARRAKLWPETVAAIREALAKRPTPSDEAHVDLVFLTKRGKPWANKEISDSAISKEIAKLLRALGINGRKRLGFYTLRHTFRTIATQTKDERAINKIMGHEQENTGTGYIEDIDDAQLIDVSDHVRRWLFAEKA